MLLRRQLTRFISFRKNLYGTVMDANEMIESAKHGQLPGVNPKTLEDCRVVHTESNEYLRDHPLDVESIPWTNRWKFSHDSSVFDDEEMDEEQTWEKSLKSHIRHHRPKGRCGPFCCSFSQTE